MTADIPVPEAITPAWVTSALRASGTLGCGEVIGIECEAFSAFNSRTSWLSLEYSSDAPSDMPTRFVLKRNVQTSWGIEAGLKR